MIEARIDFNNNYAMLFFDTKMKSSDYQLLHLYITRLGWKQGLNANVYNHSCLNIAQELESILLQLYQMNYDSYITVSNIKGSTLKTITIKYSDVISLLKLNRKVLIEHDFRELDREYTSLKQQKQYYLYQLKNTESYRQKHLYTETLNIINNDILKIKNSLKFRQFKVINKES